MKKFITLFAFSLIVFFAYSQSEIDAIQTCLNHYIEGTAKGDRDRLQTAFQKGFQLFLIAGDTLRTIDGEQYIQNVEPGKTYNRIGKIVSIDYENDAGIAKIEVYFPDRKQVATDYLLLLKENRTWKIIHKIINLKGIDIAEEVPTNEIYNIQKLNQTLLDYLDGTSRSEINRLQNAFQPGFNLYYLKEGVITTLPGEKYLQYFTENKIHNRIGRVLNVDYENDAAIAKLEVRMPDRNRRVIDYLLLLKIADQWKIIHKSFTTQNYGS